MLDEIYGWNQLVITQKFQGNKLKKKGIRYSYKRLVIVEEDFTRSRWEYFTVNRTWITVKEFELLPDECLHKEITPITEEEKKNDSTI